jgi:hypothetical protein
MDGVGHDEHEAAVLTCLRAALRLRPSLVSLGPAGDGGAQTAVGQAAGYTRGRYSARYPCSRG